VVGNVVVLPVVGDTLEEVDAFEEGVSMMTPIAPIRIATAATIVMIAVPIAVLEVMPCWYLMWSFVINTFVRVM